MADNPSLAPVVKTLIVPCTPEKAFHYFTADLGQWWPLDRISIVAGRSGFHERPATALFESRVGGRLFERSAAGEEHLWGTVTAWDPPRGLAFAFHPGRDAKRAQTVEVTFSAVPEGTRVVLTHKGWENLGPNAGPLHDEYDSGWEAVFTTAYGNYARHNPND